MWSADVAFDDCGSAFVCTRTYSTLSTVHPRSHRSLHFPSLFPHLVYFPPARRSKMNQPVCHPPLPPLSLSFPPPVYLFAACYLIPLSLMLTTAPTCFHPFASVLYFPTFICIFLPIDGTISHCWGATRMYWIQICDQRVQVAK